MSTNSETSKPSLEAKFATPESRRWINAGDLVWHKGRPVRIFSIGDLESCVVMDSPSGQTLIARLADLSTSAPQSENVDRREAQSEKPLEDHALKVAQSRYQMIEPLLTGSPIRGAADVKLRAGEVNVHFTTLYRWLRLFQERGDLSALAPRRRLGRKDTRIDNKVETIIASAIDEVFIKGTGSAKRVNSAIRKQCNAHGLPIPHKGTVRRRVLARDPVELAGKRFGNTAALALRMVKGSDPRATQPLALVQMDHTLLPVFVSRKHLKPFRPWLTLVLDVYSRMVIGFALTQKGPCGNTVGLALTHAFLPKDAFLKAHEVAGEWPCWGIMDILSCDNGSDFRGEVLAKVCKSPRYKIVQDFRPVVQPQYGAQIERLARTLKGYVRDIVGSVGSTKRRYSPRKYQDLDLFTLDELEGWMTELIVSVYHNNRHSSLGMTPLEKYREGIHGTRDQRGRGVPELLSPTAVKRLRLDFLPSKPRTVQRQGIRLHGIKYSHLALEHLLDAMEAENSKQKKKFDVRYDPADVRSVYLLDPSTDEYLVVPSADPLLAISLLDYKKSGKVDNSLALAGEERLEVREQQVKERAQRQRNQRKAGLHTDKDKPTPEPTATKLTEGKTQPILRTTPGSRYSDVRLTASEVTRGK